MGGRSQECASTKPNRPDALCKGSAPKRRTNARAGGARTRIAPIDQAAALTPILATSHGERWRILDGPDVPP
jgi:hypothetical protein